MPNKHISIVNNIFHLPLRHRLEKFEWKRKLKLDNITSNMRLITHNLLKCNIRGLTEEQGYPLRIRAETTEVVTMDFNEG